MEMRVRSELSEGDRYLEVRGKGREGLGRARVDSNR